jgi:hypothetical protein
MNNKVAKILKVYLQNLAWSDKIAGLVQTANIRIQGPNDTIINKSYPISCDITADQCKKGAYQDLAPDSKKMSVMYFEDRGVSFIERIGNRLKFQSSLRLIGWLNLCLISDSCGVSGDYVIDVIKALPSIPFTVPGFVSIFIDGISQVQRDVSIFGKYTYNEHATQYLMYPFDYFALDLLIEFTVPCVNKQTYKGIEITADSTLITADDTYITSDD